MVEPVNSTSSATATGPVGKGAYVVKQGDCLESIAFAHGLWWRTIQDAPENEELERARGPNILLPGDRLFVPERTPKSVDCATDKRHRFELKGVPSQVRIRVLEWIPSDAPDVDPPAAAAAQPRADLPYVLEIDGRLFTGQTDGDGWIHHVISPGAKGGSLTLEPGTPGAQKMPIVLGGLDPIEENSGIRQRLANLGFAPGTEYDPESEATQAAVKAFQAASGLSLTGTVDDETRQRLRDVHGC